MRWRRESRLAAGLVLGTALLLGVFLPGADGAAPKRLRERQASLSARSHGALLSLYALDSRLSRATSELAVLQGRAEALRADQERVRREVAVVQGNLEASQRILGDRLRTLYEEGEPDAIAVLLGATSLDDAVTRLDELERSARQGAQAATDARDGRTKLRGLGTRARGARPRSPDARGTGGADGRSAEARAGRPRRLPRVARPAAAPHETADPRTRLPRPSGGREGTAGAGQSSPGSSTAPAAAPWVAAGPRTLTVTSTGYSIKGRTATGLPVGLGIVAVDPSVIPLGTRLTIPGYGEGIAADTGGAVQGMTIDLWFPTLTEAMAWGRRTVTVTLH